tara:strand:- start:107306 stop:107455 length:150 start_codon:yes stop_codon:yes gene_type:complete
MGVANYFGFFLKFTPFRKYFVVKKSRTNLFWLFSAFFFMFLAAIIEKYI